MGAARKRPRVASVRTFGDAIRIGDRVQAEARILTRSGVTAPQGRRGPEVLLLRS